MSKSATDIFRASGMLPGGGGAWYMPEVTMYRSNGRLPASTLETFSKQRTIQVAGKNTIIPINYGRVSVPGIIGPVGSISGDLVVCVIWGLGWHEEIEAVYINDAAVPAGVIQTDYLGVSTQTVDPTLAAAVPAFNDPMILSTPNGDIGVCYSVFRIPSGQLDASPRFQAVVKGRRVYDPRSPSVVSEYTPIRARFWRVYITATRTTDSFFSSINEIQIRATTGGADQTGTGTATASSDAGASFDAAKAFDDSNSTFWSSSSGAGSPQWIRYEFTSQVEVREILMRSGDATRAPRMPRTFQIQYSTDGTNWTTAITYTDEAAWPINTNRTYSVPELYLGDTDEFYTNNTALCFGDLVRNPIYGLGKTVSGLSEAADWCDTMINSVERCRLSLSLFQPRRTDDYLDLLATYADCIRYNEGSAVKIVPDSAVTSAEGQEYVTDGDFASASGWTVGTGWTIGSGVASASAPGSAAVLSQTLTGLAIGQPVTLSLSATVSAGSVTVKVGGEAVETVTASGLVNVAVEPVSASPLLELVTSTDFSGSVDDVSVQAYYWTVTSWVKDSLSIEGLDDRDNPTRVFCRYTAPESGTAVWPDAITYEELPGVEAGSTKLLETTLDFPGVYRLEEAQLKAASRVARYSNRVRVSFVTTDIGARHRPGDVLRIFSQARGVNIVIKVESVDLVGYGRHRVTGLRYDQSHYPEAIFIPEDAGVVPVGLIMPLAGDTIPSGWQSYTAANGKFLMGAGDAYASGDTGGSSTFAGWSGNTTTNSSHSGSYTNFLIDTRPSGAEPFQFRSSPQDPNTDHNHSYSTGTITPNLYRREVRLAKKITSTESTFPKEVTPLGLPGLLATGMSRLTSEAGRLLMAEVAANNAGVAAKFLSLTSGNTDDGHEHRDALSPAGLSDLINTTTYSALSGGGSHNHTYNLQLNRDPIRCRVAMYAGTQGMPVLPGMIGFWDEVTDGAIPSGWIICDGTNGTPPIQNRLIEIAAEGNEGTTAGDNTLSVSGNGSTVSHQHRGSGSTGTKSGTQSIAHSNTHSHTHTITRSDTWTPPYFALSAIMYSP